MSQSSIVVNLIEPVGAHAAQIALQKVPSMPAIEAITINGLQATIDFVDPVDGSTVSLVHAVLPNLALGSRKISIIQNMSADIATAIVTGFSSSCTGTTYFYDTGMEDQLNIVGATVAHSANPQSFVWHVRDAMGAPKHPIVHTGDQIVVLGLELASYKESRIGLFQEKRAEIEAALSHVDLDALEATWDPYATWTPPAE